MQTEGRYKVESQEYSVKLKKLYSKIVTLFPAPNKTFVFLAVLGAGSDGLVHVDRQGTVLFEHEFGRGVDSVGMVSSEEVVALEPRLNQITVFSLTSHSHFLIPFNFTNEECDQNTLHTFTNSKHLCVVENGRYNDNRLKLSYFANPLTQNSKPFHVYESDCEWNYQYLLRKGNEDSMMLWFKARHDQEFELKTYELPEGKAQGREGKAQEGQEGQEAQGLPGQFRTYRAKNSVGSAYEHSSELQLGLANAWEVEDGKFCLVCSSEKTNLGLKNSKGCVNNNFIWEVKTNEIRETQFWFDEKYNDYLIDIHSFGQFSIFRTYFFTNGAVESSPCYYVHNPSERIVATSNWECSYLVKFEYPGYEPLIVESEYENADVEEFKVRIRRICPDNQ